MLELFLLGVLAFLSAFMILMVISLFQLGFEALKEWNENR